MDFNYPHYFLILYINYFFTIKKEIICQYLFRLIILWINYICLGKKIIKYILINN